MRKIALTLMLAVTAGNLAAGVAYAAVCESTGGARACGGTCATNPGGSCSCTGACSADELRWVDGAHKGGGGPALEELLAE